MPPYRQEETYHDALSAISHRTLSRVSLKYLSALVKRHLCRVAPHRLWVTSTAYRSRQVRPGRHRWRSATRAPSSLRLGARDQREGARRGNDIRGGTTPIAASTQGHARIGLPSCLAASSHPRDDVVSKAFHRSRHRKFTPHEHAPGSREPSIRAGKPPSGLVLAAAAYRGSGEAELATLRDRHKQIECHCMISHRTAAPTQFTLSVAQHAWLCVTVEEDGS